MKFCLDPGHGMPDPGALGSRCRESDINLSIAKKLKEHLVRSGIQVIMTREGPDRILTTNYSGDLQARVSIANKSGADYFVSIHCNSGSKNAHGTETYCFARGKDGEKLAKVLQKSAVEYAQSTDRGVKVANFYVLRKTKMPAALIELLFISNPEEEKKLAEPQWQAGMAEALARGICEFVNIPFKPEKPKHPIMGESEATAGQMEKFLHTINPAAPYLAKKYIQIGKEEGVRGDMAFAQSIKETGYFRFGGAVGPDQNNFAGLMDAEGKSFFSFPTPEDGIRAQIQHLKAYASTQPLNTPLVDPRFHLVKRGSAPNWEDLNGRWAVPGTNYGESIVSIWKKIKETKEDYPLLPPFQPPDSTKLTKEEKSELIRLLGKLITILKEE